jgi:O-methyltransferase involved in polyketide biosynthesis
MNYFEFYGGKQVDIDVVEFDHGEVIEVKARTFESLEEREAHIAKEMGKTP